MERNNYGFLTLNVECDITSPDDIPLSSFDSESIETLKHLWDNYNEGKKQVIDKLINLKIFDTHNNSYFYSSGLFQDSFNNADVGMVYFLANNSIYNLYIDFSYATFEEARITITQPE